MPKRAFAHYFTILSFVITITSFGMITHARADNIEVDVSFSITGSISGLKVYAFTDSGVYTGLNATTDANGSAFFDKADFSADVYQFRVDYLNEQFWSGFVAIANDFIVSIVIEESHVDVTVRNQTTNLSGIKVYLFSDTGAYLGKYGITDENGLISFTLPDDMDVKFRADNLGYQFWCDPMVISPYVQVDLSIPYQDVTITINGVFQTTIDPVQNIKVYLFTPSGTYLGRYQNTNANGQVSFSLPERAYKIRVDYQGKQYWSSQFTGEDTDVDIPLADADIKVTGSSLPISGAPVYVFLQTGSYLGINGITDGNGQVSFRLAEGNYKFRADYQGNQYWSTESLLVPGQFNDIGISTGGGALTLAVRKDAVEPLANIPCYVFNESGTYLGINATTNANGEVMFNLSDGNYQIRADYMGYQFWTQVYEIPGNLSGALNIDHTEVNVLVQKTFQGGTEPAENIPAYLFLPTGAYLGISQTTDTNGQVVFSLPNETYKIRADYLSGQFWSNEFTATDTIIDIPMADTDIYVSWNDQPIGNLPVYVFNENGSYLGISGTTDVQGEILFKLPASTYDFRADYLSNQYWSGEHELIGDEINPVDIFIGGGTFNLTILKDYENPVVGKRTYLFNSSGSYLGIFNTTDENGQVSYDLPKGNFTFRVDTMGYQYWTNLYNIPDEMSDVVTIPYKDVTITIQANDPDPTPLEGVNTYLFKPDGTYIGLNQLTGADGMAIYNLPNQEYKLRADFLGYQFWSDVFQWQDTILPISRGTLELYIHLDTIDIVGAKIYLFSESGTYLGMYEVTDEYGIVSFLLPDLPYKFRIDYDGSQYWSDVITASSGFITPIDIDLTPPLVDFSADPTVISLGESSALTWTTINAYSCSIEPDIGVVDVNGSISVSPGETKQYTITATGPGGSATADVSVVVSSDPVTINVPIDFPTIQAAIDAAVPGDTVQVEDGYYTGPQNTNLDFSGKAITVSSANGPRSCTIDSGNNGRAFYFHNNEGPDAVVSGFTILNGNASEGSGILCQSASPTIKNCIIKNNTAQTMGAGMHCDSSSPVIINCVLMNNTGPEFGGGIACSGNASPHIINCTIIKNSAAYKGGGIYALSPNAAPFVKNSIVWGNTPDGINNEAPPSITVTYCDVQGNDVYSGEGNINADPLFFSHVSNDYHIASNSPCIDSGISDGAPTQDIDQESRSLSAGIDIGSDEFTDTDSDGLSNFHENTVYGTDSSVIDTDQDGISDLVELDYWGSQWDQDPDNDGRINIIDPDADNDNMPDGWEIDVGLDPQNNEAGQDNDSDGFFNYIEYKVQTDPTDPIDRPFLTISYEYNDRGGVVLANMILK